MKKVVNCGNRCQLWKKLSKVINSATFSTFQSNLAYVNSTTNLKVKKKRSELEILKLFKRSVAKKLYSIFFKLWRIQNSHEKTHISHGPKMKSHMKFGKQ